MISSRGEDSQQAISLPDEIISEILTPVLRVSDHLFSDTTTKGRSPFATNTESTSAMLVVCKAWLRVVLHFYIISPYFALLLKPRL
jgi:hypothetical protein